MLSTAAFAFAFGINTRSRSLCGSNHRVVDLAASIKQYRVGAGSRYRTGPHQLGRLRHISYTIPACSVLFYTGCIRIPDQRRSGKQQRTRQCRTKQNKQNLLQRPLYPLSYLPALSIWSLAGFEPRSFSVTQTCSVLVNKHIVSMFVSFQFQRACKLFSVYIVNLASSIYCVNVFFSLFCNKLNKT